MTTADETVEKLREQLAAQADELRRVRGALELAREFAIYKVTPDRNYAKEARWEKLQAHFVALSPPPAQVTPAAPAQGVTVEGRDRTLTPAQGARISDERLIKHLERMHSDCKKIPDASDATALHLAIERLQRLRACERDAERYRGLKEMLDDETCSAFIERLLFEQEAGKWDSELDAAIAARGSK